MVSGAARRDAGIPRIPAQPRRVPRTGAPSDPGSRGATLEVLADEKLERAEVALGEILEALAARGDCFVRRAESLDDPYQMLRVLPELELDRPPERRLASQRQGCGCLVPTRVDQRAKPEALEPLGDRAPVPAERPGGCLHVERVTPEGG